MSHHVLALEQGRTGWLVLVNVSGVAVRQPLVVLGPGARTYDWEEGGGRGGIS